jgi:3-deoxy-D-manno-octulosonic-acid transferase
MNLSLFRLTLLFFHFVIHPMLVLFLIPFKKFKFLQGLQARWEFEGKNKKKSLRESEEKISQAFEVSSEGELEQVRPLIMEVLRAGDSVELIICSPSVELAALKLEQNYPAQFKFLRMPLLRIGQLALGPTIASWCQSPQLTFCQYDFFPELLLLGMRKKTLRLVNATTHRHRESIFTEWFFRGIYESFESISFSNQYERELFEKRFLPHLKGKKNLEVKDYRSLHIRERLKLRENTLKEKLGEVFFKAYFDYLDHFPKEDRLLGGSFWPLESKIFLRNSTHLEKIKNHKFLVTLVPHQLDELNLKSLVESIEDYSGLKVGLNVVDDVKLAEFNSSPQMTKIFFDELKRGPSILILNLRGILCELYPDYCYSYVGGGFTKMIHSVLEPYCGGSHVFVGPKNQKSSELTTLKGIKFNLGGEVSPYTEIEKLEFLFGALEKIEIQRGQNCHDRKIKSE